jgi:hypothetical protein
MMDTRSKSSSSSSRIIIVDRRRRDDDDDDDGDEIGHHHQQSNSSNHVNGSVGKIGHPLPPDSFLRRTSKDPLSRVNELIINLGNCFRFCVAHGRKV